jgi:RHS repeat-associated protein
MKTVSTRFFVFCIVVLLGLCFQTLVFGQATIERLPAAVRLQKDGREPVVDVIRHFLLNDLTEEVKQDVFPAPPCLTGSYYVGWQLYYDLGDMNTAADWTVQLEVTLMQGEVELWTKPLQVASATQTLVSTIFHDQPLVCEEDYYFKVKKVITGVAPAGNIRLKQLYYNQQRAAFVPSAALTVGLNFTAPHASFSWSMAEGAIAYDVEWVYISNLESFTGTTQEQAFLFKEPVRVTTTNLTYKHPFYYPNGRIWARVRALGFDPVYPDHLIVGQWSYATQGAVAINNPQPDLNWQLQTHFSEEGKYKKLMSYYDGSSRARQSLTNLSSGEITVVAESLYDYEGRKAVDVMPVPVAGSDLRYKSNLNSFNTAADPTVAKYTSATKKKFHYDNSNLENSTMATSSGAGQYYSAANPLPMQNKSYLSDAGGYVYSQTEFSRDNTGRPVRQSGVGELYKTDGQKANLFYYGNAAPAELIRLFGSNVGNASHYKKNLVVDANGQVSVSYLDQSGKTIATALAGAKPANTDALESYNSLSPAAITVDISSKNRHEGGRSTLSHKLLNTSPNTNYQFNYKLSALASEVESFGCQSCSFDLKISLTDPTGQLVSLAEVAGNESATGFSYERKGLTAASCAAATALQDITINLSLAEIGDYTLVKELIPVELSYEQLTALVKESTTFAEKVEEIRSSYPLDPAQCEVCVSCNDEEANSQLETVIGEIADQDCENIKQGIIEYYLNLKGRDYEVTQADLEAHADYCKYLLCEKNKASDVFEKKLSLANSWTAATGKGYHQPLPLDPFFTEGLSGAGKSAEMEAKLNLVKMDKFEGTIWEITDPADTDYYINENGEADPVTGKHFLYMDLMSHKATMPVEEYNQKLDEQRWTMFRNIYLKAKRDLKLTLTEVQNCASYKQELELMANLPTTESGIIEWGGNNYTTGPVSEHQLEMSIANISNSCEIQLTDADNVAIAGHLREYFNSNEQNFFRLILAEDIAGNNTHLVAVQQILNKYNCSLSKVAVTNPVVCKTEETVLAPDEEVEVVPATTTSSTTETQSFAMSSQSLEEEEESMQQSFSMQTAEEQEKTKKEKREKEFEKQRVAHLEESIKKENEKIDVELKKELNEKLLKKGQYQFNNSSIDEESYEMSSFSISSTPLPDQSEYDALMALYASTQGPNWKSKHGWETADPNVVQSVQGWYGIVTDENGHVTNLRIYTNNLNGTIPPEIEGLTYLKELTLASENLLSGPIPIEIGNLQNLTELTLAQNQLTGTIPSQLSKLSKLTYINLITNKLEGNIPPSLGDLTELQTLYLSQNRLSGPIPVELGKLKKLTTLSLSNNQISGNIPPSFGELAELQTLYLVSNRLTGPIPTELSKLSKLVMLMLANNELDGTIPPVLGNLTSLTYLNINNNNINGTIPKELGDLSNLQRLDLSHNPLSGGIPVELGKLSKLVLLGLSFNQHSGVIPRELSNCTELTRLSLQGNKFSGKVPSELSSLSKLNYLQLRYNQFEGDLPFHSSNFGTIQIEDNNFTFSNFLPIWVGVDEYSNYSPQGLVDVARTVKAPLGSQVTLKARIDRNTSPASKYQWFKNGVALIPAPTYEGHTYTIPSLGQGDLGTYHYLIINEAAPNLTLQRHPLILEEGEGNYITVCREYEVDPIKNPTLAYYNIDFDWNKVVETCMENQRQENALLIERAIEKLVEKEVTSFYNSFVTTCLSKASEHLSYSYENKEYHYTLYYYDQAGNLVQTVPPKGVSPLSDVQVSAFLQGTKTEPAHSLKTQYRYSSLNQLIWQQSPDAGVSQFYYDSKGQLRLSQNAKQNPVGKYSYTKHDALGRIIEVGELSTTETLEQLLAKLDDAAFPDQGAYSLTDITRTHYDLPAQKALDAGFVQQHLRSRVSWTEVMDDPSAEGVATFYSYDIHGNVKTLQQKLPGIEAKETHYVYDLISSNVKYVMYQYDKADQLLHSYKYDADNRIEYTFTSTDGFLWDREAKYHYYAHGPLARVELGEHNVQGLDYYYTLQGWIKGVNMPYEGDPGSDGVNGLTSGKDEFAYTLGYHEGDYKPIGSSAINAGLRDQLWTRYQELNPSSKGLYNGNISWMVTNLPELGRQANDASKGMQAMLYTYDQLNRISAANSLTSYVAGTGFGARTTTPEAYDTRYSYDANGNLLTLQRWNDKSALQDDFTYNYYAGTNRLKYLGPEVVAGDKVYGAGEVISDGKVYQNVILQSGAYVPTGSKVELFATNSIQLHSDVEIKEGADFQTRLVDGGAETGGDIAGVENDEVYLYDAIGNLVADHSEGIEIGWTVYGKIREVRKTDGTTLHFSYDAAGNRVEKKVSKAGTVVTTRYIRDASGNVMAIYQDDALTEQPLYGSSRLGSYRGGRLNGERQLGHKQYELSNHLGNVLAVVTDNISLSQEASLAHVVTISDYYPFGSLMPGRSYNSKEYRYGYNGKELDKEGMGGGGSTYDYGFRIYNPQIARFLSVDPLSDNFPYFSPYQFAGLDPIKYIDLDGLERAYIDPGSGMVIPASDFFQHTPPPGSVYVTPLPSKEKQDQAWEDLNTIGSFIPVLGDGVDAKDAYNDFNAGNYGMATLSGLSLIPGGDFIFKPIKLSLKNSKYVREASGAFSKERYRDNLKRATGKMADGYDAHHTLPKADKFKDFFEKAGLDVNDPANMIWRERKDHQGKKSSEHSKLWNMFMQRNPNATKDQILEQRDIIEKKVWGNTTGDTPTN